MEPTLQEIEQVRIECRPAFAAGEPEEQIQVTVSKQRSAIMAPNAIISVLIAHFLAALTPIGRWFRLNGSRLV